MLGMCFVNLNLLSCFLFPETTAKISRVILDIQKTYLDGISTSCFPKGLQWFNALIHQLILALFETVKLNLKYP